MDNPKAALVRELYRAFEERDAAILRRLIREDTVWHVPGKSRISGEYRGQAAIFAYFGRLAELSGGTFRSKLLEGLAGEDHAVALVLATGRRGGR